MWPAPMHYRSERSFDGQRFVLEIQNLQVPTCGHCGEVSFTLAELEHMDRVFCYQLGLLQPHHIRGNRARADLSQKELADRLGVSEEKVDRWENQLELQTRAMDDAMRAIFGLPEAQFLLSDTPAVSTAPATPAPSGV